MLDSAVGVSSFGASVARRKFIAFCVSAFMAAIGGALYSAAGGLASPTYFFTLQSLLILALAVIGGITSWIGALIGATLYLLFVHVFDLPLVHNSWIAEHLFQGQLPGLLPVFFGLGAIGLAQNPHGGIEQIRQGTLRAGEITGRVLAFLRQKKGEPEAERAVEVAESEVAGAPVASNGGPVVFPQGRLYHRPDCVLTVGKDGGSAVDRSADGLRPCPICEPEPVTSSTR